MGSIRLLAAYLLIALGGCSSRTPASLIPTIQAVDTTTAPAARRLSILRHDGCTIDLAKVCKSYIDQPQFTYNGDVYDWQRFQQSVSRHPDVEIWARYPDGTLVADVECHVDGQNRKIDWARLLPNPPMTDDTWQYARSEQWCQEESWPDYSAWGQYWQSGISRQ